MFMYHACCVVKYLFTNHVNGSSDMFDLNLNK